MFKIKREIGDGMSLWECNICKNNIAAPTDWDGSEPCYSCEARMATTPPDSEAIGKENRRLNMQASDLFDVLESAAQILMDSVHRDSAFYVIGFALKQAMEKKDKEKVAEQEALPDYRETKGILRRQKK